MCKTHYEIKTASMTRKPAKMCVQGKVEKEDKTF